MPHGRLRNRVPRTHLRRRERFTTKRLPLGYASWLRFAADVVAPEEYLVQSKRGYRVHVVSPDPKPIRRAAREELTAATAIVRVSIERIVQLAAMTHGWREAPHEVWKHGGEGGVGLRLAARLVGGWPVLSPEGAITWTPFDEWEKAHTVWLFVREEAGKKTDRSRDDLRSGAGGAGERRGSTRPDPVTA